jgi:hypothetical protein
MADQTPQDLVKVDLFDWTGGIRNKRVNPLQTSENAFVDGENIDLVDGCLRTQRGSTNLNSGVDTGEVMVLQQVRFPTQSASFIIAQVSNSSGAGS